MLPLRGVLETVGYNLFWDGVTRTVVIAERHEFSEFERGVFELTNVERQNYGLSQLVWCDILATAARNHSMDLAQNLMTGHVGSDGSTVRQRIERAGLAATGGTGENVIAGHSAYERSWSAGVVVWSWMGSAGHRENILHPDILYIGVGYFNDGTGRAITQKFYAP
jgi:uncharacterized protein YkwD